ncbi:NAD(P)H-dependent oxidoreductase [Coraliomargarita akajimensis]|uniref:NAD(P)H dehydrogenase (Quinone) n=1 Tax=Coraliomargarita akajimensis (strain DSM 45221 / IAM 15411 / JCM 23193 / KCTC 12865 / 04OKA010-24) TaxID=583355 RepID=D5EL20_CORAD|nr:NAD(P)H-dependent oxidoreductase [Coraliomargarita akajimensis]ADE53122.1 NAD(P)H dehydrogenase (quinone) [Coraliomargarita akajimensis DSM 45221]
MQHALIINAHQRYEGFAEGKLNHYFASIIQEVLEAASYSVQVSQLEQGYDLEQSIAQHEWADLIILQTPAYWFGTPWIHKRYIDEVFTTAMSQNRLAKDDGRTRSDSSQQYGSGGLLQGKRFMISSTWNAPADAFNDPDQALLQGRSVDDVFYPVMASYRFCGATILPTFASHDVYKAPDIQADAERLKKQLRSIIST